MPKIIPIKELKDMAKISEMCHENEGTTKKNCRMK